MTVHTLAQLALELRDRLTGDDLTGLGRIELSDGVSVDAERMARIVLADLGRRDLPEWLTERELQQLRDDLLRLLALVHGGVRA